MLPGPSRPPSPAWDVSPLLAPSSAALPQPPVQTPWDQGAAPGKRGGELISNCWAHPLVRVQELGLDTAAPGAHPWGIGLGTQRLLQPYCCPQTGPGWARARQSEGWGAGGEALCFATTAQR